LSTFYDAYEKNSMFVGSNIAKQVFAKKKQLISNLVNHMIFIQCNTVSQMVTLPDSIMIEHPPSTSVIFPPQIEEIPHLWARPTASFTCRRVWRGKKE